MAPVSMGPGDGPGPLEVVVAIVAILWAAVMSWLVGRKDGDDG